MLWLERVLLIQTGHTEECLGEDYECDFECIEY